VARELSARVERPQVQWRRASLACGVSPRDLWQYCRYCRAVLPRLALRHPAAPSSGRETDPAHARIGASYLARWSTDTQPRRSGAVALPGAGARLRRDRRERKDLVGV